MSKFGVQITIRFKVMVFKINFEVTPGFTLFSVVTVFAVVNYVVFAVKGHITLF